MFLYSKLKLSLIAASIVLLTACNNDDPAPAGPEPTGKSKEYSLNAVSGSIISGTVEFIENTDNSTTIEITLSIPQSVGTYPAHIHFNSAAETGAIAATLADVDGSTGRSSTTITALDNGTLITYDELLEFNGHINVHLSATELSTLVSQGDIGQNELTGNKQSYVIAENDASGVSGTLTIEERINGTSLATIELSGTSTGTLPAHLHFGNVSSGGAIAIALNPVDGSTGQGKTQIAELDTGEPITYAELLVFDGHVKVHASPSNLETIVAQGDIGSNTGESAITYNVTNNGSSAYVFNGNGLTNATNPALSLVRGTTYIFNINAPTHPFFIKTVQGTGSGSLYTNGVDNNGATVGTITFMVPNDAPGSLFYNCEFHGAMTNSISITN